MVQRFVDRVPPCLSLLSAKAFFAEAFSIASEDGNAGISLMHATATAHFCHQ
jgi:hypothetical protein